MFILSWNELLLVISCGGVMYELEIVIPPFSRELVVPLGCLFCSFFSNVKVLVNDIGVSLNGIHICIRGHIA